MELNQQARARRVAMNKYFRRESLLKPEIVKRKHQNEFLEQKNWQQKILVPD